MKLEPKFLKAILDSKDSSGAHKINLNNSELQSINEEFPLSFSKHVTTLYLSNNLLKDILGISQFTNLKSLSLAFNYIQYYEDVDPLKHLPFLEKLSLDNNPATLLPFYREYTIHICRGLILLDDCKVTSSERKDTSTCITKLRASLDQLSLSLLRCTVLAHFLMIKSCHISMKQKVISSFRTFTAKHIGSYRTKDRIVEDSDSSSTFHNTASSIVLRIIITGGVMRLLQSESKYLKFSCQDVMRIAHLRCINAMTHNERQQFSTSRKAREMYWEDFLGECMKKQQLNQLRLMERIEDVYQSINSNTDHSAIHEISSTSINSSSYRTGIDAKSRANIHHREATLHPQTPSIKFGQTSLESIVESIQFVPLDSTENVDLGCGIGPTCQSRLESVININDTKYSRIESKETNLPSPVIINIVQKMPDDVKPSTVINHSETPFLTSRQQSGMIPQVQVTNAKSTIIKENRVNESKCADEIKEDVPIQTLSIDKSDVPLPHISIDATLDTLRETLRISQVKLSEVKLAVSSLQESNLFAISDKTLDFPPIQLNPVKLNSESASMHTWKSMVNKAIDSVAASQAILHTRNQYLQHHMHRIKTIETTLTDWNRNIFDMMISNQTSIKDVILQLKSITREIRSRSDKLHTNITDVSAKRDELVQGNNRVLAMHDQLLDMKNKLDKTNVAILEALTALEDVDHKLSSDEVLLMKRHHRFRVVAEKLADVFNQQRLLYSFSEFKERIKLYSYFREAINMFQSVMISNQLHSCFIKMKSHFNSSCVLRHWIAYGNRLKFQRSLNRWTARAFALYQHRKQHHYAKSFIPFTKIKSYFHRWTTYGDRMRRIRLIIAYLLLKRTFLLWKRYRNQDKLSKQLNTNIMTTLSQPMPESIRLVGIINMKTPTSPSSTTISSYNVSDKIRMIICFKRWCQQVDQSIYHYAFKRTLFRLQKNMLLEALCDFKCKVAIHHRNQYSLGKAIDAIYNYSRRHTSYSQSASLASCYLRRLFTTLQCSTRRSSMSMLNLSKAMSYYLDSIRRRVFYQLHHFKQMQYQSKKTIINDRHAAHIYSRRLFARWRKMVLRRLMLKCDESRTRKRQIIKAKKIVLFMLSRISAQALRIKIKRDKAILSDCGDCEQRLNSLRTALSDRRIKYQGMHLEYTLSLECAHDLHSRSHALAIDINDVTLTIQHYEKSLSAIKDERAKVEATIAELETAIAAQELPRDDSRIVEYQNTIKDVEEERSSLIAETRTLESKLSTLQEEAKKRRNHIVNMTENNLLETSIGVNQAKISSANIANILNDRELTSQTLAMKKASLHSLSLRFNSDLEFKNARVRDLELEESHLLQRKELVQSQVLKMRTLLATL